MNAYKTAPLLALTTLEKIAEEIPSGVSPETVGETVAMLDARPCELTESLHRTLVDALKSELEAFWDKYEVEKKLEAVKYMKMDDANKFGGSFRERSKAMQAMCMTRKKECLMGKLKEIDQKKQELEKLLKTKADLIRTQLDSIKTCDHLIV